MPLPQPHPDETSDDFMQRCMANSTMVSEYPDNDQRLAVCIQQSKKEVDNMSVIFKSMPMEVKSNSSNNLVFKISTNIPDRDEDILEPQGVKLENYRANPCVLFAHNYENLPVGRSVRETVYPDYIESEVEFAPTEFAQDVRKLCEGGFLRAASVGFIGHKFEPIEGSKYGKRYTEWELLEWSVVPVPSNFGSLIQNAKSKGVNLDAMEKELSQLEQKAGAAISAKNRAMMEEAMGHMQMAMDMMKEMMMIPEEEGAPPMEPMMTATRTASMLETIVKVEMPEEFKQALEDIKSQVFLLSQKGAPRIIDLDAIEWTPTETTAAQDELNIEPGELKNMIAEIINNQLQGGI